MLRIAQFAVLALFALAIVACGGSIKTMDFPAERATPSVHRAINDAAKRRGLQSMTNGQRTQMELDKEVDLFFINWGTGLQLQVMVSGDVKDPKARQAAMDRGFAAGKSLYNEATGNVDAAAAAARADAARRNSIEARAKAAAAAAARAATDPAAPRPKLTLKSNTQAYCCINKRYYDCKTAEAVNRCVGPVKRCTQKCGMTKVTCMMDCLQKDPPDPSLCNRTPAKDGQCK